MPDFSKAFLRRGNERPLTIGQMYRRNRTNGDVGIELEFEGNKFRKDNAMLTPYWGYHKDGSLRGNDNAEYVLNSPIPFNKVKEAVEGIWNVMDAYGTKLDVSNRTSVHVHLNVQKFHLNRLCSFVGLWFVFEELLAKWCGEHREGNLFCLRAKDAPAVVSNFKALFVENRPVSFAESMHYAGLNGNALKKFGSIEIRTMRGAVSPKEVLDWVGMLQKIYDISGSATFSDPRAICDKFSGQSPVDFLTEVFEEYSPAIIEAGGGDLHFITESLYEGVRYAQDVCYCRDWGEFLNDLSRPEDPFDSAGRGASKPRSAEAVAAVVSAAQSPTDWWTLGQNTPTTGLGNSHVVQWANMISDTPPPMTGSFLMAPVSVATYTDIAPTEEETEEWMPPEWYDEDEES